MRDRRERAEGQGHAEEDRPEAADDGAEEEERGSHVRGGGGGRSKRVT